MIRSFRHKGLERYFVEDDSRGIRPDLAERCRKRLTFLHRSLRPEALNIQGWRFHKLHGKPVRYSVHVNGPWCITFEWEGGNAWEVDLEQYH